MAFTIERSVYDAETARYQGTSDVTMGVGTTLRVYNDYVRIMSDESALATCATYLDLTDNKIKHCDWVKDAKVDATAEIKAKVREILYEAELTLAIEDAAREAQKIVKGSIVKVVSGRTGKGIKGLVAVSIQRAYGMGYRAPIEDKLAIATSEVMIDVPGRDGKVYKNYRDVVWVWARNCQRVDVAPVDVESVKERAADRADRSMKKFA